MPAMSSFLYENPENPCEEIDTPWGKIPRWKASTLATGSMGAFNEYMKTIRADAADASARIALADARADELERREGQLSAREALIKDAVTKVTQLLSRADSMLTELEERSKQQAADEEEEQELETNLPGGELHDLPPKQAQDPDEPDPIGDQSISRRRRDQGDLPEELTHGVAFAPSTYPTLEDPPRTQVPQPTSISLNAEDD
jgi:hypothetical protein